MLKKKSVVVKIWTSKDLDFLISQKFLNKFAIEILKLGNGKYQYQVKVYYKDFSQVKKLLEYIH